MPATGRSQRTASLLDTKDVRKECYLGGGSLLYKRHLDAVLYSMYGMEGNDRHGRQGVNWYAGVINLTPPRNSAHTLDIAYSSIESACLSRTVLDTPNFRPLVKPAFVQRSSYSDRSRGGSEYDLHVYDMEKGGETWFGP